MAEVASDPADVSLKEINEDSTAYLLPDYSYDREQDEILAAFYELIFEEPAGGPTKATGRPKTGFCDVLAMFYFAAPLIGH